MRRGILAILIVGRVWAADPGYLRSDFAPSDLWQISSAVQLSQARLAYLDVVQARKLFDPVLNALSDDEFRKWYLSEAAFIAAKQPRLNGIRNGPIPVNAQVTKTVYRPPDWRRSAVIPMFFYGKRVGWIDAKGFGLDDEKLIEKQENDFHEAKRGASPNEQTESLGALRDSAYRDGLCVGGETVAELTRQRMLQALYNRERRLTGQWNETVETLAVIDPNFEILRSGNSVSAAIVNREAHWGREASSNDFFDAVAGGFQSALDHATADFGGLRHFENRKSLQLNPLERAHLHSHYDGGDDPQLAPPWQWGQKTFDAFHAGHDDHAVERHLSEMLGPFAKESALSPPAEAATLRAIIANLSSKKLLHSGNYLEYLREAARVGAEAQWLPNTPGMLANFRLRAATGFGADQPNTLRPMIETGWLKPDLFHDAPFTSAEIRRLHANLANELYLTHSSEWPSKGWLKKLTAALAERAQRTFASTDPAVTIDDRYSAMTMLGWQQRVAPENAPQLSSDLTPDQFMSFLLLYSEPTLFPEFVSDDSLKSSALLHDRNFDKVKDIFGSGLMLTIHRKLRKGWLEHWTPPERANLVLYFDRWKKSSRLREQAKEYLQFLPIDLMEAADAWHPSDFCEAANFAKLAKPKL